MEQEDLDSFLSRLLPEADVETTSVENPIVKVGPETRVGGLIWASGHTPTLTIQQESKIKDYLRKQRGAPLASIALLCKRNDCCYRGSCPLFQLDPMLAPLGAPCPIETTLIDDMLNDYMRELGISEDNVIDLSILKEFVMYQIYAKRAREELAEDPRVIRKEFAGIDAKGNVITKEVMNPIFTMLDKQSRVKQKLLESLIATRESKSKANASTTQSFSTLLVALKDRIEEKKKAKLVALDSTALIEAKIVSTTSTT